mgnify:CR=1 FL=1
MFFIVITILSLWDLKLHFVAYFVLWDCKSNVQLIVDVSIWNETLSQVKIYGLKTNLNKIKLELSDIIHECIVESLSFPKDKKYHRFITFDKDEMLFPDDKSDQYTIIEIMMMEGRSTDTKKHLIKSLFTNINDILHIDHNDLEVCIIESPACNWGFRGMTGDQIKLGYKVNL